MSELVCLLEEKRPFYVRLAKRYAPPGVDPEDCVQDASLLAFRSLQGFRGRSKLSTWLQRIVINCARMSRRRNWRRANDVSLETPIRKGLTVTDAVADRATPADRLLDQQMVVKMIGRLGQGERAVMECTYLKGLTLKETSQRLKMPLGTVKSYRSRAPKRIRRRLKLGN